LSSSPTDRLGGYWGGERRHKPNAVPRTAIRLASTRHIITIDERLLAELGLPTWAPLSLFETMDGTGREHRHVERNPAPAFAATACTGEPLCATPARSFPALEAVSLYGGPPIATW
jgi:hypothetical protein